MKCINGVKKMCKNSILCIFLLAGVLLVSGCTHEDVAEPIEQGITAQEELDIKLQKFNNICTALAMTLKADFLNGTVERHIQGGVISESEPGETTVDGVDTEATKELVNASSDTIFTNTEKERLADFEITNTVTGYSVLGDSYVCLFVFTNPADETTFLSTWYSDDGVTFTHYINTRMTQPIVVGDIIVSDAPEDMHPNYDGMYEEPDYSFYDEDDYAGYWSATAEGSDVENDVKSEVITGEETASVGQDTGNIEAANVTHEAIMYTNELTQDAQSNVITVESEVTTSEMEH